MRKYLKSYLEYIDSIIARKKNINIDSLKEDHLKQIQFMQHERLIHLIVTALFSVLLFICIGILTYTNNLTFVFLTLLILALLIPYILHYYFLENSVQKMYRQFNSMSQDKKIPEECRQSVSGSEKK